jgi:hypothetical protein
MEDSIGRFPGANQDTEAILAARPRVRVTWHDGSTVEVDRNVWEAGAVATPGIANVTELGSGTILYPPEHTGATP